MKTIKIPHFSKALLMVLAFTCIQFSPTVFSQTNDQTQKAILVTGASSGIGRKITETLADNGYLVYAGARKQADLDALNAIENVQAIRLDVTIQQEIDDAVSLIQQSGTGLYALVNNAGVAVGAPLIEEDIAELQWIFDVNVFGVYRVTKAFAPLIIEQQGRITTIGSIAGTISGPSMGQYSMTKHAIEAYTDALAAELGMLGVKVSVIEPGNYKSQIQVNAIQRALNKDAENSVVLDDAFIESNNRSEYKEPDEVAEAALHALFNERPKKRYMVVPNQQEAEMTINAAIQRLVELNAQQPYSYSKEELADIIDKAYY